MAATGGFDNRAHVIWETTKGLNLSFTQGIFSKEQFNILTNYKILTDDTPLVFFQKEILESGQNGQLTLKYPMVGKVNVINKATRQKISYTAISETTLDIGVPYTEVIVLYETTYTATKTHLLIGERQISGFVTLQGKTRIKDDITGAEKTGILLIPKLQLTTNFNLRLGKKATPVIADFIATAHPVGARGKTKVADLFFLNEDTDAY